MWQPQQIQHADFQFAQEIPANIDHRYNFSGPTKLVLSTVQNHGLCGHFTPVVSNAGQTGPIERSSKKIFYLIILQAPNLAAFPKVYCIHMTTHACKVQPCRTLELQLDPITASFLVLTQNQHTKYQPREIPKCFTMGVAAATIQRINPTIQRPRCQLR